MQSAVEVPVRFSDFVFISVMASKKKPLLNLAVPTGTKVFVMPGGMMKSNNKLVELIEKVKPEIRTLIEKCNTVKMWVQLLIPRIEDGNNFGVSIQEDYRRTVTEIDEKEYISLKIIVSELRNHFSTDIPEHPIEKQQMCRLAESRVAVGFVSRRWPVNGPLAVHFRVADERPEPSLLSDRRLPLEIIGVHIFEWHFRTLRVLADEREAH
ncbi:PSME3 protein, partial [Polypterus senegalus]